MNLYHVNNDKNQYYLLQLSQRGAIMVEQMNDAKLHWDLVTERNLHSHCHRQSIQF